MEGNSGKSNESSCTKVCSPKPSYEAHAPTVQQGSRYSVATDCPVRSWTRKRVRTYRRERPTLLKGRRLGVGLPWLNPNQSTRRAQGRLTGTDCLSNRPISSLGPWLAGGRCGDRIAAYRRRGCPGGQTRPLDDAISRWDAGYRVGPLRVLDREPEGRSRETRRRGIAFRSVR